LMRIVVKKIKKYRKSVMNSAKHYPEL